MLKFWCLAVVIAITIVSTPAYAEVPSMESILQLMQATDVGNLGDEIVEEMLPELQKMLPNAPDRFWKEVKASINADSLISQIIPIYQKYLTAEDVAAINAFYKTPAGQKLVDVQGVIMEQSYQIGEEWGRQVVEGVLQKYQAEVQGAP
ncbi:MAG: DUF2059 domain-containing protein [Candidatus Omnitrophica bacterium]|nr:DUF2059 domain-containing protein [Candidatus Omnitrophota bacterium]